MLRPTLACNWTSETYSRKEILGFFLSALAETEDCFSLSSPGNFGKSSLLRELAATGSSRDLLFLFIDCNLRADNSPQAFYELILRILLPELKFNPQLASRAQVLYDQLLGSAATLFSFASSFITTFEQTLQTIDKKVVLLLDEFDGVLKFLPDLTLLHFRALKDKYPDRLSFVIATGLPLLASGREEEEGVAEFYELFSSRNQVLLGGLNRSETTNLASRLAPNNHPLSPQKLTTLYDLSGGHPNLIKLVVPWLNGRPSREERKEREEREEEGEQQEKEEEKEEEKERALNQLLREDREIKLECGRIWASLPESEQKALLQYLEGVKTLTTGSLIGSLQERGLVAGSREDTTTPHIFSRCFEWYLTEKLLGEQLDYSSKTPTSSLKTGSFREENLNLSNPPASPLAPETLYRSIAYDPHRQEVILEGGSRRVILSGNASILFRHLFSRQSEPYCTKEELITAIWGNDGYGPENLDRLLSDLREEIGDEERKIIRTLPRKGLQMVGVARWQG